MPLTYKKRSSEITENPTLHTTQFAWLAVHSHQISADWQGSEGTCDFHTTLYLWIRQPFCTSLKVASSESRLFYTTTVGHRLSASACQKEKMLLRSSDVPQAIQQLETEKKERGCGVEKNCKEEQSSILLLFFHTEQRKKKKKSKTDALYHLLMRNR